MKFRTILPVGAVIIAGTLFAALVAYQAQLYVDIDSHPRERWREGTTHDDWFVSYDSNPCGRVEMLGPSGVYVADLSRCGRLRATKTRSLQTFSNPLVLEMRFRIMQKTLKDTKIWHTVWVGWHHSGDNRWNNLILKASGWELGKFHPACPKGGAPTGTNATWRPVRSRSSPTASGTRRASNRVPTPMAARP